MAAAGRDLAITVGVVRAPYSGIELVLSKKFLPVAQIRVICKNVPQVNITNKMTFSKWKFIVIIIYPRVLGPIHRSHKN
jgi:hypothetical protein